MTRKTLVPSMAAFALLTTAACAQNPPTPPALPVPPASAGVQTPSAAAPVNESGSVRYIVYGPRGEVQTLILRNDRVVSIPPDLGEQIGANLSEGTTVAVTGIPQTFGRQRQVMAQSLKVNGQSFAAAVPPAPAAPGQQPPAPPRGPVQPAPAPAAPAQPVPPPPPAG